MLFRFRDDIRSINWNEINSRICTGAQYQVLNTCYNETFFWWNSKWKSYNKPKNAYIINNCLYTYVHIALTTSTHESIFFITEKNTEVKKTTLITHRIIIIIDGNLFQNCILLPHTYIYTKIYTIDVVFLTLYLFLDAEGKKRNRKTFKIDVVKRYVRDSLSHYLMLFLTWYFCFYLRYYYRCYIAPECNISCTLVDRQCESFVVVCIK